MAKYGSNAVFFLVAGYDMLVNKLQGLTYKIQSLTEPTHGLGDSWEEHIPVSLSRAELSQEGAFFDTSTSAGFMHMLNSTTIGGLVPSSTPRVVCIGTAGNSSGQPFMGVNGEFEQDYEVLAQNGKLSRANASYVVTGSAEPGTIIRPLTTATIAVTDADYLDNGAATTAGAACYFQVTALTLDANTTAITLSVQEAASSAAAWTVIATVTTTGIGAWRVRTTDDTIERWLAGILTFSASSGSPSVTAFIGCSRL